MGFERFGRAGNLVFEGLLFGGVFLDVHFPAGQLRGQPGVLPLLADGDGKLILVDTDLDPLVGLVDLDRLDLGRLERLDHKFFRIVAPFDDVDFLVVELAHDIFDARTAHTDTRADRIDLAVHAGHRDLGAHAGFPGNTFELHRAVGDLAHFQLEQFADEIRMTARKNDLRTVFPVLHRDDVGPETVAHTIVLGHHPLARGHHGLELAEVENHVALDEAAHRAADDVAGAVFKFLVNPLFLDPANTRHDGIARHAGSDAAESGRLNFNFQRLTRLNARFEHLGAGQQHFLLRVAHLVDY